MLHSALWQATFDALHVHESGNVDPNAYRQRHWADVFCEATDRSLLLHCLVNTPVGASRITAPRGDGTYAWILRYQLPSDLRYLSGDFLHHHGSYENANGNQWPPQFGMMRDDYDSD